MTAIVVQGDALALPLPDDSVDLIVTSPPYFGLRSYTDDGQAIAGQVGAESTPGQYLDALIAATREWLRVLKPAGSLFINLGDKYGGSKSLMMLPQRYAIRCMDELGLILRAEIIWAKPNGLPESVTDRVRRSHEQLFHFTSQPRYYANMDAIREPYSPDASARRALYGQTPSASRYADADRNDADRKTSMGVGTTENPAGKLPGSVWTIPTSPLRVPEELNVQHFAAYPPALVKRIVLGWSPPGGVVLDPFGGTGTTALVASAHGRVGISVDLSHDYSRVAQWRTSDPKQRERAAR